MGGTQSKTIHFQAHIDYLYMEFNQQDNVLNIKAYSNKDKIPKNLIYDIYYDNISLPEDLYKKIKTVQQLTNKIREYLIHLEVKNDSLFIKTQNQILAIPLGSQQDEKQFHLETDISFRIKAIPNELKNRLPYNAAVLIVSYCNQGAVMRGSGVIIQKGTILTVAHNVYDRTYSLEAQKIEVYVQSFKGLQKISVRKHYFPKQYKTINQTDLPKYDFAYLQLQKNDIISSGQILPLKWDWIDGYKGLQIFGFSQKLDKKFQSNQTNTYHMKCSKAISLFQNFIVYDNKAQNGISGGPIVIQQEKDKFKLIGLHQGFHRNFSRGVLLSSFGKNPFQLLTQMSGFNENLQNILNPLKAQAEQEKQLLKKQIERLKIQNQKQKNIQKKSQQKTIESIKNQQKLKNTQKIFKRAQEFFLKEKLQESQLLCNQCLQFQTQFPGVKSIEYAQTLHLLGRIYFSKKQYDKSLEFNLQSLEIKENTIGKNHERYTATINNMGLVYKNMKKFDQSLQCFQSCLQIESEMRGKNTQFYMSAIANIGYVQMNKKNYQQALKYLLEYQKKYKDIIYKDQEQKVTHLIDTLSDIGTCYSNLNDYKKSLEYRLKALKAMEDNKQTQSIKYADKLQGVGTMYSFNQQNAKSLQYYLRYLSLLEELKQTKQQNYTVVMACIIQNYQRMNLQNREEKINLMCKKIIATCEMNKDIDNQTYLYAIDYLARNLFSAKQYKQAFTQYKKLQTILSIIDSNLYLNYRKSTDENIRILEQQLK